MSSAKSVMVRASDENVQLWVKQLSETSWRAWGPFRGRHVDAKGGSEAAAIQRLQEKLREEHHIYVLALEDGCFYVGRTKHLRIRLWQHFKTKIHRSGWTLLHRPLSVIHVSRIEGTTFDLDRIETTATLRLAQLKGFDKVRGGAYTTERVQPAWLAALEGIPPADEAKFQPLADEKLKAMIKNAYFEYAELCGLPSKHSGK